MLGTLLFVMVAICGLLIKQHVNTSSKPLTAGEMLASQRYIIHAGGFMECNGQVMDYTNTYETLENLYDAGNRVAEYDFLYTSDGAIVCAHDEGDKWARGYDYDYAPTLDEFLGTKYQGELTPMNLEMLAEFMSSHKDFYVVTDVKDDNIEFCQHVKDTYPELMDQFIIQIYHADGYDPVREMGFQNIIFTFYRTNADERVPEDLLNFLSQHEVMGVTFWDYWAEPGSEFFDTMVASGVPMYVHTINSVDSMKAMFDLGIAGIYTDVVDPSQRY